MKYIIKKHILSVFEEGELMRLKDTGEIFIYHSGSGGANFSTIVTIQLRYSAVELGSLRLSEVEKVNKDGDVIDDFTQYENL